MIYTIKLSDGSEFTNLTFSGNNFISTDDTLAKNLKARKDAGNKILHNVVISSTGTPETEDDYEGQNVLGEHALMKIVQVMKIKERYFSTLIDVSEAELREKELYSRLAYLEMLTEE